MARIELPSIIERRCCTRSECRRLWGEYRSLAIYSNGRTVAACHDWLGPAIERYRAERDDPPAMSERERAYSARIDQAEQGIQDARALVETFTNLRDELVTEAAE